MTIFGANLFLVLPNSYSFVHKFQLLSTSNKADLNLRSLQWCSFWKVSMHASVVLLGDPNFLYILLTIPCLFTVPALRHTTRSFFEIPPPPLPSFFTLQALQSVRSYLNWPYYIGGQLASDSIAACYGSHTLIAAVSPLLSLPTPLTLVSLAVSFPPTNEYRPPFIIYVHHYGSQLSRGKTMFFVFSVSESDPPLAALPHSFFRLKGLFRIAGKSENGIREWCHYGKRAHREKEAMKSDKGQYLWTPYPTFLRRARTLTGDL